MPAKHKKKWCAAQFFCGSALVLFAFSSSGLIAQSLGNYSVTSPAPSSESNAASALSQGPFGGSVPEGKATGEVLPLTFRDAIDRGLRNNLGLLLQSDNTLVARAQRWQEL